MRLVWLVIGVLAVLIGIVWTLQGFNVISGGGMSGHAIFAVIGIALGIVGVALIAFGVQRRAPTTS